MTEIDKHPSYNPNRGVPAPPEWTGARGRIRVKGTARIRVRVRVRTLVRVMVRIRVRVRVRVMIGARIRISDRIRIEIKVRVRRASQKSGIDWRITLRHIFAGTSTSS